MRRWSRFRLLSIPEGDVRWDMAGTKRAGLLRARLSGEPATNPVCGGRTAQHSSRAREKVGLLPQVSIQDRLATRDLEQKGRFIEPAKSGRLCSWTAA